MRDPGGQDLADHRIEIARHSTPERGAPARTEPTPRLEEIGGIERPAEEAEVPVAQRVIGDRRQKLEVVHSLLPEPDRSGRTMEHGGSELPEFGRDLTPQVLGRGFPEHVVQPSGSGPPALLPGGKPQGLRPAHEQAGHPRHVLTAKTPRTGPLGEGSPGGCVKKGVEFGCGAHGHGIGWRGVRKRTRARRVPVKMTGAEAGCQSGSGVEPRSPAPVASHMPFPWDSVVNGAVAAELHRRLRGGRTRAIHLDPETRELRLFLRGETLLARLHPVAPRVLLLPAQPPFPGAIPLPGRLSEVRAIPEDRVLRIRIHRLRGPGSRTVVLEFLPGAPNALVLEEPRRDPDGEDGDRSPPRIRHVLRPGTIRERRLVPGAAWHPPTPPPTRLGFRDPIEPEAWSRITLAGAEPDARRSALLRNVAWTSNLNAEALLRRPPAEAVALQHSLGAIGRGRESVHGAFVHPGDPAVAYPIDLAPSGPGPIHCASMLDALERVEEGAHGGRRSSEVPPELLRVLERRIEVAEGRARALRRELADAPDPDEVRLRADLLLSRFREVRKGAASVELEGFDGEPVEISLDPALSPQENAARIYEKAARAARTRSRLPDRILAADRDVEGWRERYRQVVEGEIPPDALTGPLGIGADRPGKGAARVDPRTPLPYRSYRSSGGLEIRVGKGARSNDDLTFRHSAPGDVWLHARDAAGAHVVLRWRGPGAPPARDLEEAAVLAALHSRSRTSSSVPVDWTERRHVRKPRKAPPGLVAPSRVRTLFVDPDPEVARILAEREAPAPGGPSR